METVKRGRMDDRIRKEKKENRTRPSKNFIGEIENLTKLTETDWEQRQEDVEQSKREQMEEGAEVPKGILRMKAIVSESKNWKEKRGEEK